MKELKLISKNIAMLILAVSVVSIVVGFILTYNSLHAAGAKINHCTTLLLLVAIAATILLFLLYISSVETNKNLNNYIDSQKQELNKALSSKKTTATTSINTSTMDIEQTIANIIPSIAPDNMEKYGEMLLSNIAQIFEVAQGTLHLLDKSNDTFSQVAGYAFYTEGETASYKVGETLAGQVAKNREMLNLTKIPDNYVTIMSGLGKSAPNNLLIVPIVSPEAQTIGIIEISSFKPIEPQIEKLFASLTNKLGIILTPTPQNPVAV